jgi:hypothetical protein
MLTDMLNMLEVWLPLELRRHHLRLHRTVTRRTRSIIVIVVVVAAQLLAVEIGGSFVLVGPSIILVSAQDLANIATRVFIQLLIISKYYDRDIDGAKNGKLMRLLEQTTFALQKSYGAVSIILDGLDLNLSSPHCGDAPILRKVCSFCE